jgi:hypothetical protein
MELLQKQQEILSEKIKAEERKKKLELTIEKLKELNIQQQENIKKNKFNRNLDKCIIRHVNLMTAPRFEVILEVLKRQEERIRQLETK